MACIDQTHFFHGLRGEYVDQFHCLQGIVEVHLDLGLIVSVKEQSKDSLRTGVLTWWLHRGE